MSFYNYIPGEKEAASKRVAEREQYLNSLPAEHAGLVLNKGICAYCDPWGNPIIFIDSIGKTVEELFATNSGEELI